MLSRRSLALFLLLCFAIAVLSPTAMTADKRKPLVKAGGAVKVQAETTPEATSQPASSSKSTSPVSTLGPAEGEEVNWSVMAGGGGTVTAGDFVIASTIGQPSAGTATAGDLTIHAGYWQDFGSGYLCGDADGSGRINISDAVFIVAYIFGGPAPEPLLAADTNCSGSVNISDVVFLVGYIFGYNGAPCDTDGDGFPDC
jgi:hypothetical protein